MEVPTEILNSLYEDPKYVTKLQQDCLVHTIEIDHVTEPISYELFLEKYMLPNRACVLGRWATEGWRSRKDWVLKNGQPHLDFLKDHFGNDTGPVADCNQEKFSSHQKQDMRIEQFLDYLEEFENSGYSEDKPCLYLKDWHFQRSFPDYHAYMTPVHFKSDWLNEFWDNRNDGQQDDYRFVYFGPKNSWTPLHADVFRSYSWSANICGRKKWIMFPPGEEDCLKDVHGQLAFDLRSPELLDKKKYPKYGGLRQRFEVIQEEGEIIFVPTGWHHQVFNLVDTISINHNWMNGCNSGLCWSYIKTCLEDVKREISDCRDMEGWSSQCQLILKATAGVDYAEFFHYLHLIGQRRLQFVSKLNPTLSEKLQKNSSAEKLAGFEFGSVEPTNNSCTVVNEVQETLIDGALTFSQAVFDLIQVQRMVEDMLETEEFIALDSEKLVSCPKRFLQQLRTSVGFCMEQLNG